MLSMIKNEKNESPIEKVSTLTPAHKILFLSYLSLPQNKSCIFYLLGHRSVYGYTLSATSRFPGFILCLRYRYKSQFDGVYVMPDIKIYITVWRGLCYAQDRDINHSFAGFLLCPRYRYLLTITIGTYQCMLILAPFTFK